MNMKCLILMNKFVLDMYGFYSTPYDTLDEEYYKEMLEFGTQQYMVLAIKEMITEYGYELDGCYYNHREKLNNDEDDETTNTMMYIHDELLNIIIPLYTREAQHIEYMLKDYPSVLYAYNIIREYYDSKYNYMFEY